MGSSRQKILDRTVVVPDYILSVQVFFCAKPSCLFSKMVYFVEEKMTLLTITLISVGLAMDALAVSLGVGTAGQISSGLHSYCSDMWASSLSSRV